MLSIPSMDVLCRKFMLVQALVSAHAVLHPRAVCRIFCDVTLLERGLVSCVIMLQAAAEGHR